MPDPILFIDHATALGGAEHSLLLLLQRLDRARWQPHLACAPGALAVAAQKLAIPLHPVELPRLRRSARFPLDWARGSLAIASLARQLEVCLVHANTVRAVFYAAPAARLARRPLVWHMRDFWLSEAAPRSAALDRLAKRVIATSAARIVANSHATARHLPFSRRLSVVYNGIDLTSYDPLLTGDRFRDENGIPNDAPVVGVVGRLRPWKGQERFLRVAAQVAAAVPSAHLVIAGGDPFDVDGGYPAKLRHIAATLGIAGRVTFTGQLADVRPALAALDLFVHPGDPEPFGLANVEAMAMGLPVVAFAHGALPEIVSPASGVLVSPGDEDALARAVIDLIQDPQRRARLGAAGRQRAETYFSIDRVVGEMETLFAALA